MHVGTWGLAVIVIVMVSWLLYRYLAPQNWKEWSHAGVVQAFIIAFYAEMYGFPLTIYFLARFFGLDVKWREGGNLWEQIFGTPVAHLVAMVIGYIIVFAGATLVADGWRRIHQARSELNKSIMKKNRVIMTGGCPISANWKVLLTSMLILQPLPEKISLNLSVLFTGLQQPVVMSLPMPGHYIQKTATLASDTSSILNSMSGRSDVDNTFS
ncbi:hypothetical protein HRM2_00420 [Desulforapulum autotrophicum HRM2]|uniref:Uncharacterized protein n=1 Tax=Desulforapulum autotrophicum (strain ATCC 43914 / DSM 3382 / VKM B-1955 / HRM2) TaxID=177437 RepID=C0QE48_DESAH|nr:hypothetical protein HRM2_00420 [Desulforapulum autotrophicum HRM2]